ncbi:unnamed protein product [Peronospora belbahrii]|uniref:Uncharacterized protein n=1 Tax=Peronospora belbahrii TaxID=622444 RepID=A0AAU9L8S7_9STRA|nr:unnamed protein product [Peronospora belbahrii]
MVRVDIVQPQMSVAEMVVPSPTSVYRQLDMNTDEADEASELPTVYDLIQEVTRLEQVVREMGKDDGNIFEDECTVENSFTLNQTPLRYGQKKLLTSSSSSDSLSKPGIYLGRQLATNVDHMSPYKNVRIMGRGEIDSLVVTPKTPPTKQRETSSVCRTVPRPTRVAALTRENISLLPMPRTQNFTGSVCGSQKSRTSICTDGGAVFSRLYQPDFYKNREEKFKNMRDRRDSFNCLFTPRTTRRDSISSRDSIDSQTSMQSAKTDIVNVSSRLYDPDYIRKRNARLQRMRQEREMRECTFRPTINANAYAKKL